MWKKILVAIDGSAPSLHALKVAAGMAANNKAELTILSVVPPIPSMGLEGEMPQLPDYIDTIEESVKKMVASKVKEVEDSHSGLKVVPIIMTGSPSRKIVEAARAREVDLIVVGNRGTGGILNWMLGSVSRQVTDACTVPVLVVKDRKFCKAVPAQGQIRRCTQSYPPLRAAETPPSTQRAHPGTARSTPRARSTRSSKRR